MTTEEPDDPDPHADGANGAGSVTLDEPDEEPAPTPEAVAELAASCARFVLAKYKVPLDGTPDTLGILDHYVKEARGGLEARPEGLALLEAAVGAYFGEVVRRAFDATWWAEGDRGDWRLRFRDVFLTFNPLGMAREALTRSDAPGWHAHIEVDPGDEEEVARRLSVMPEVDEEEYYALTTRLDVLEVTVSAVRARMIASGLGDVLFTDEDYEGSGRS